MATATMGPETSIRPPDLPRMFFQETNPQGSLTNTSPRPAFALYLMEPARAATQTRSDGTQGTRRIDSLPPHFPRVFFLE